MAGCLHRGKTGFDALTHHQHAARRGEPHCTAAAWAEHHFLGLDPRLALSVARKEGPVDRQRRVVNAARDQRDHRGPNAARRTFQTGMKADRRWWWKMEAAGGEIPLSQRAACWPRRLPDSESDFRAPGITPYRLLPL